MGEAIHGGTPQTENELAAARELGSSANLEALLRARLTAGVDAFVALLCPELRKLAVFGGETSDDLLAKFAQAS